MGVKPANWHLRTYRTGGRKFIYGVFFNGFTILSPSECSCLFTKNGGDGLDGITILELLGKWMIAQYYARLPFVALQGSLEEHL